MNTTIIFMNTKYYECLGAEKKNENLSVENVDGGESGSVGIGRRHPSLPTRLIDIGPGEDIQPRLCLTAGWTDAPAYATLTYCRSREELLSRPRLTSSNAQQFIE